MQELEQRLRELGFNVHVWDQNLQCSVTFLQIAQNDLEMTNSTLLSISKSFNFLLVLILLDISSLLSAKGRVSNLVGVG